MSNSSAEPLPPFNVEAEESVIASLMVDDGAADRIAGLVTDRDFFRDSDRWAYQACTALWRRGQPVNQVTVADELVRMNCLEGAGGLAYLARITSELPTPVGVEHYATLVHRDAVYRALITAGTEFVRMGYKAEADLEATLLRCEALLQAVRQDKGDEGSVHRLEELLNRFWDQPGVEALYTAMVRSGYPSLDVLLGGFRKGALITVAAKTGIGKSALLLNIARNAAVAQNFRVMIVSLEMSGEEWTVRLLAHETGIDSQRLRLGGMTQQEEQRAMTATADLASMSIDIDDRAYATVDQIRAAAKRKRTAEGLDLVLVDYLQLAAGGRNRENRVQEVTDISRGLKRMARDLDVPVVAAAQLSRSLDYRKGKQAVPRLSDLRESGSIEQDSDQVLFLHRESDDKARPMTVIVAKNRGGPTGTCRLKMHPATSRFEEVVDRDEEYEPPGWAK